MRTLKGIRMSHGAVFVTDGIVTVRLLPSGECTASPISYAVLEHDLAFEKPETWDYINEHDILSLPNGDGERIVTLIEKIQSNYKL